MEAPQPTTLKPAAVAPLQPIAVSVNDAAKACGLSRSGLYHAINEGRLKSVHVGSRRLIKVCDLQAFIDGGTA